MIKHQRNAFIVELYQQGKTTNEIQEELSQKGIELSIRTIQRILQQDVGLAAAAIIRGNQSIAEHSPVISASVARIGILEETEDKFFVYSRNNPIDILKKCKDIEDLMEYTGCTNKSWIKETLERGVSEFYVKDYLVKTSFKNSFDTTVKHRLSTEMALKELILSISEYVYTKDDVKLTKTLQNILENI